MSPTSPLSVSSPPPTNEIPPKNVETPEKILGSKDPTLQAMEDRLTQARTTSESLSRELDPKKNPILQGEELDAEATQSLQALEQQRKQLGESLCKLEGRIAELTKKSAARAAATEKTQEREEEQKEDEEEKKRQEATEQQRQKAESPQLSREQSLTELRKTLAEHEAEYQHFIQQWAEYLDRAHEFPHLGTQIEQAKKYTKDMETYLTSLKTYIEEQERAAGRLSAENTTEEKSQKAAEIL